jgi:hypothetical protein
MTFGQGLWRSDRLCRGAGGSGWPMIEGLVVSILATACALLAKQIL